MHIFAPLPLACIFEIAPRHSGVRIFLQNERPVEAKLLFFAWRRLYEVRFFVSGAGSTPICVESVICGALGLIVFTMCVPKGISGSLSDTGTEPPQYLAHLFSFSFDFP